MLQCDNENLHPEPSGLASMGSCNGLCGMGRRVHKKPSSELLGSGDTFLRLAQSTQHSNGTLLSGGASNFVLCKQEQCPRSGETKEELLN